MKSILIVDDSAIVRRLLRETLEEHKDWFVCGEAENGSEGIDKAQQLHPDLIVLDMAMPVMDGLRAARKLKRLMPEVPLIMFTTFMSAELRKEALAAGFDSVSDKSENVGALVARIHELLNP